MTKGIEKVIENIANDVLTLAKKIVGEELSANKRPNKGVLKNSALQNDVQVKVLQMQGQVVIQTMFNNYLDYIEQGRKPRSGKQPPIDALREWALSRGIPTDNSTLFLIGRAIWRDGLQARPILATLEEKIEEQFEDQWADLLFESITDELNKYFI